MADVLEDVDLAGYALGVRDLTDFLLLEEFDCDFLVGVLVDAESHLAECALA